MSHQISNRRFTATRFRKSGPERVTQIVPNADCGFLQANFAIA
jgi:hypothetical protein